MIRIYLYIENDCQSCRSVEARLTGLTAQRPDVELVALRRGTDNEAFVSSNVLICPAVFVETTFVSYGMPDTETVEFLINRYRMNFKAKRNHKQNRKGDQK